MKKQNFLLFQAEFAEPLWAGKPPFDATSIQHTLFKNIYCSNTFSMIKVDLKTGNAKVNTKKVCLLFILFFKSRRIFKSLLSSTTGSGTSRAGVRGGFQSKWTQECPTCLQSLSTAMILSLKFWDILKCPKRGSR